MNVRAVAAGSDRATRLREWALFWDGRKGDPNPFVKQLLLVAIPVPLAAALSTLAGESADAAALDTTVVVILFLAALAISILISLKRGLERWGAVPPLLDLMGIGAMSVAVGGHPALFLAVMVLPVCWIASIPGRRNIALAFGGTAVAVLMPHILGRDVFETVGEVIYDVFPAGVLLVVAAITNQMSTKMTDQFSELQALAEEQEHSLAAALINAAKLRQSEAEVRESGRVIASLWEASTELSIIGTTPTGLIDAWGPGASKLLGLTREAAEGKRHISEFHVAAELEAHARELNYPPGETVLNPGFSALVETARKGNAESLPYTYVRADGTEVPVQLSVTPRLDDAGDVSGYLFVAVDQTQAREVSRMKDEFVGLISHELRTPLSSVLGYLELIGDDDEHPLSEEQQQYLSVAERNATRLLRLVGDLLFTAQVDSGKFSLDARDVDLAPIVMTSIETAGPVATRAGVRLIADVGAGSVIVRGDTLRLGQSIDNLISNAVKFTPRGGSVTVSLNASGPDAVIAVRDTGYGIPADEMEKLFGRFFRASTATKNAVPGVGLGLTITQAIITAHGGHIAVDSRVGEGTGFVISLPLLERHRQSTRSIG